MKHVTRFVSVIGLMVSLSLFRTFPALAEEVQGAEAAEVAEEKVASGEFISSKISRLFPGSLDSVYTLTIWEREGEPDVPYVSLQEYVKLLYADTYDSMVEFSWEGNTLLITRHGMDIRVDVDAQTISCKDYRVFQGPHAAGQIDAGILVESEFLSIRPSQKNESVVTSPQGYEIHLGDYGMEMVKREEDLLMPFAVMQDIFAASISMNIFAYNGEDYFNIVSTVGSIYGTEAMSAAPNPYTNKWYSGPFAGSEHLGEAYAKYNYASMCLLLDLTYGHKEEKGIESFDVYFEEKGLKEAFLTPEPEDDQEALQTMYSFLFDSGHDAEALSPSIIHSEGIIGKAEALHELLSLFGYHSFADVMEEWEPYYNEIMKLVNEIMSEKDEDGNIVKPFYENMGEGSYGPGVEQLAKDTLRMTMLKPFGYGSNRVDIIGDTGIIYFEAFLEDLRREESFYTRLPYEKDLEKSTFALFYYAFDLFKKNGNVNYPAPKGTGLDPRSFTL